jgi:hypothetical protein
MTPVQVVNEDICFQPPSRYRNASSTSFTERRSLNRTEAKRSVSREPIPGHDGWTWGRAAGVSDGLLTDRP